MTEYVSLSDEQLHDQYTQLVELYNSIKELNLNINLTRGNPSQEQLEISQELLYLPGDQYLSPSGIDCRNYGHPRGLPELGDIFAPILPVPPENIIPCSNSSLQIMQTLVTAAMFTPPVNADTTWDPRAIKFLCPYPGYDRHFSLIESFGITMIPIPIDNNGPDMAMVEHYASTDPNVKGIWIVPIYSNPTAVTISEENTDRLARMTTAAPDFRIFWDNAYAVHTLTDYTPVRDIFCAASAAGHQDRVYIFASTSKISFAGSGISFLAASERNLNWYLNYRNNGLICPDKLNQLRHLLFFKDTAHVYEIMQRHRAIIKPKFDMADRIFHSRLSGPKVAHWNNPEGGYFMGLYVMQGTAKRVVQLAGQIGIALTPAGAAFPYGIDPHDEFIRLALTFLSGEDIIIAADSIATCVLLAAVEKLLNAHTPDTLDTPTR